MSNTRTENPLDTLLQAYAGKHSSAGTNGNVNNGKNGGNGSIKHCIDAQFGINRKDSTPLDIQKHAQVIHYLRAAGFTPVNEQGTDRLTIVPVKQYSADNYLTYSNIQFILQEPHVLREFCNSAEETVLSKYARTPFLRVCQRTYIPVEAYMADNNMTVTYHQEQDIDRIEEVTEAAAYMANWAKTKKKFKLSNIVTFTHPHYKSVVELHTTRESKYEPNSKGKMVPVPTYSFAESNVGNSDNNKNRYEIYIRFPPSTDIPFSGNSKKSVLDELRAGSRLILSGIQSTQYPIPFSERDRVLTEYVRLFKPGHDLEEKRFGGVDLNAIPFIGPYTDTIGPEHVQVISAGEAEDINTPNIRSRYTVTDKTDGSRALLFIASSRKMYMITPSMNVIYTGAKITDQAFVNTLFDGEFVEHDKKGRPLQLFATFDIYFDRGMNVRGRPFLRPKYVIPESEIVKDEYPFAPRFHLLEHLINTRLKVVYEHGKCATPFQLKAKSFYYPQSDMMSSLSSSSLTQSIFQVCKKILEDDTFEYERDGLIFTHMDVPVSVNNRNIPLSQMDARDALGHKTKWKWSLKWKPPSQNSIDFLIQVKKTPDGGPQLMSEVNPVSGQFARYQIIHLLCGGTNVDDPVRSYLFPSISSMNGSVAGADSDAAGVSNETARGNRIMPVLFKPDDPPSETAHIARLPVEFINNEWVIRTDAGEFIEDNTIVEFYYDMDKPPQYRWRPMRVRYDKTHDYQVNKKRVYGNAFTAAARIWSSIHNPITTEMISSGANLPVMSQDLTNVYYNRDGSKIYTEGLRQFHNYYVKQKLLSAVLHDKTTLVDYTCGRGGDLNKWCDLRVPFVLGIDISRDNIYNAQFGMYARLANKQRQRQYVPAGLFIQGNSTVSIRSGEIAVQEEDKAKLMHVFGNGSPLSADIAGPVLGPKYGIGKSGFDVGSCQFSIHYFFKDPETVHAFMKNVAQTIALHGYFVGTCFDGATVFEKVKQPVRLEIDGNTVFRAERKYTSSELGNGAQSLGYPISVFQDSINQTIIEYLVKFEYLCDLMKVYGFTKVTDAEARDLGLVGRGMFSELFADLYASRSNRDLALTYSKAIHMTDAEKEISSWNRWFVFRKTDVLDEAECQKHKQADMILFKQHEAARGVLNLDEPVAPARPTVVPVVAELFTMDANEGKLPPSGELPFESTLPNFKKTAGQTDNVDMVELTVPTLSKDSSNDLANPEQQPAQPNQPFEERPYQTGEAVTLFHSKARRPLYFLSSYTDIGSFSFPDKPGVFRNPSGLTFPSAEHAFQSQYFSDSADMARFSSEGDLGKSGSGFELTNIKDKPKDEWTKRNGIGVIARTAVNTKTMRAKLKLNMDTAPTNKDETWIYVLSRAFSVPALSSVLLDTGNTYLLEKDDTATASKNPEMGGIVTDNVLYGRNKMGQYMMHVRKQLLSDQLNKSRPVPTKPPKNKPVSAIEEPRDVAANSGAIKEPEPIEPMTGDILRKRDYLFKGYSAAQIAQLHMDAVSAFSVTETQSANTMTELIQAALRKTLQTVEEGGVCVLDGMACVGGNTISFASAFPRVISNELDTGRFTMLQHNVKNVMKYPNVQFLNESVLDVALKRADYDVLFLDPEWGGPEYKDKTNLVLPISGESMEEFCLNVLRRMSRVSLVAIKLPMNYNNRFIEDFAKTNGLRYEFHTKGMKKMSLTLLSRETAANALENAAMNGVAQNEVATNGVTQNEAALNEVAKNGAVTNRIEATPTVNVILNISNKSHECFYDLETAYQFFLPFLPSAQTATTEQSESNAVFAMTPVALRNTLDYFMNVLFQTGFILVVPEDVANSPAMYAIRMCTDRLDERVYVPFIKQHMDAMRKNRSIPNHVYNKIAKQMKQPYRLLGSIVKDVKNDENQDINEYEQFMRKYNVQLPPGVYYMNLSDTVVLHPDGLYPTPFVNPTPGNKKYYQTPLLPVFGSSGRSSADGRLYHDIIIPNYDDIMDVLATSTADETPANPGFVTDWSKKTNDLAVFRGSATGEGCSDKNNMRIRLAKYGSEEEWKMYLDTGLTSDKSRLKIDDTGICTSQINKAWIKKPIPMTEQSRYKYLIHVDGNVAAYRLLKTMQTGSLILRVKSPFTQWADKYLVAGRHYMEVAADLSDLKQVLDYCQDHDAECAQIAADGKEIADRLRTANSVILDFTAAVQSFHQSSH